MFWIAIYRCFGLAEALHRLHTNVDLDVVLSSVNYEHQVTSYCIVCLCVQHDNYPELMACYKGNRLHLVSLQ